MGNDVRKNKKNKILLIVLSCLCAYQPVGATGKEELGFIDSVMIFVALLGFSGFCTASAYG